MKSKKIIQFIIGLIAGVLVINCQGINKNHSHGSETHEHDELTIPHNSPDDYFGAYNLEDEKFGTKTNVTITAKNRVMVTNSLPNHLTGEFPNSGNPNTISAQNRSFDFPLNPKYTGNPQWIRETGIALNGIKFEPGTAEVVVCESGENYRVEGIQDVIDMGLDFNHAHVQPTGAYHYHGVPTAVIKDLDSGEDLVHIGFAHDGFPIYYSKNNTYKPSFNLLEGARAGEDCSYTNPRERIVIPDGSHHDGTFGSDFEYVEGSGDLDECNGITIDGKYMYLVTVEFPYISRCLMGEFESKERGGPPQGKDGGAGDRRGGKPSVEKLFEKMDSNTDGEINLKEAQGPLKQKFSEVDRNGDGVISKKELEGDLARNKSGERRP